MRRRHPVRALLPRGSCLSLSHALHFRKALWQTCHFDGNPQSSLFVLKVKIPAEYASCGEDVDGRVRPVLLHSRAAGTESRSRRFDLTDGFEEEAQLQVVQMVCFLLLTFLSTRLILQLNSGTAFSARAAMLHTLCNSFLYASRLSFPSLFTSPIFCYLFKVHAISKGLSLERGRCKKCAISISSHSAIKCSIF